MVALRDGRVVSQGSLTKALEEDSDLSAEAAKESQEIMKAKEELTDAAPTPKTIVSERKTGGKLVVAEEVSKGRVSWSTCAWIESDTLLKAYTSSTSKSPLRQHRLGVDLDRILGPLYCVYFHQQSRHCLGQLGTQYLGETV